MRSGYKELIAQTANAYLIDADKDINQIQQQVVGLLKHHKIVD